MSVPQAVFLLTVFGLHVHASVLSNTCVTCLWDKKYETLEAVSGHMNQWGVRYDNGRIFPICRDSRFVDGPTYNAPNQRSRTGGQLVADGAAWSYTTQKMDIHGQCMFTGEAYLPFEDTDKYNWQCNGFSVNGEILHGGNNKDGTVYSSMNSPAYIVPQNSAMCMNHTLPTVKGVWNVHGIQNIELALHYLPGSPHVTWTYVGPDEEISGLDKFTLPHAKIPVWRKSYQPVGRVFDTLDATGAYIADGSWPFRTDPTDFAALDGRGMQLTWGGDQPRQFSQLWCTRNVACTRALGESCFEDAGAPCHCGEQGECMPSGNCRCNGSHVGGEKCTQTANGTLDVTQLLECPDPAEFDLCGNRGECVKMDPGPGVYCQCKPFWFGGNNPHGWTGGYKDVSGQVTYYRFTLTEAEQIKLYQMELGCAHGDSPSPAPGGDWGVYVRNHQCLLYDGPVQALRYKVDTVGQAYPNLPVECADLRHVNTSAYTALDITFPSGADRLYGGFHCTPCPNCDPEGTASTGNASPDYLSPNISNTDRDARAACVCQCHAFASGDRCQYRVCPYDEAEFVQNGAIDVCLQSKGHGSCLTVEDMTSAERVQFNVTADRGTGVCQCRPGFRGSYCQLDSCPIDSHSTECGIHGQCNGTTLRCMCDDGWSLDAKGLCTVRRCDVNPQNGLECNGLTVLAGYNYTNEGENVCNRDPAQPVCECHKAHPPTELRAADNSSLWFYNDGDNNACTLPYTLACQGVNGLLCSGHGVCHVDGCHGHYDNCEPKADLNGRPTCSCANHGDVTRTAQGNCDTSVCGGFSSLRPCTEDNAGVHVTGYCNTLTRECECRADTVDDFVGANCEVHTRGCSAAANTVPCNGHGECKSTGNTATHRCICDKGYNGTFCEQQTICSEAQCPLERGVCVEDASVAANHTCQCFRNYYGAQCQLDGCELTGGVAVTPNVCQCPANSTQYPGPNDALPFAAFRGCRKLCGTQSHPALDLATECGSLRTVNGVPTFTMCGNGTNASLIAANDAGASPSCSCGSVGLNVATGQTNATYIVSNHSSAGEVCEPRCLHCVETPTGACNASDCPQYPDGLCQYTGPRCSERICHSNHYAFFNGTACACNPEWAFADNDTFCSHDLCVASGGALPSPTHAGSHGCICPYPLQVDTNPDSTTYRLCVDACGPFGTANLTTQECVCMSDLVSGPYCEHVACDTSKGYVTTVQNSTLENATLSTSNESFSAPVCVCRFTQFTGPACNESACVHGTPNEVPTDGCACAGIWTGALCTEHTCVHGQPTSNATTAVCACEPGWGGALCDFNLCGKNSPLPPEPCGAPQQPDCVFLSLDYNCACGDIATFNAGSGHCEPPLFCGEHGHLALDTVRQQPYCNCHFPWSGLYCDALPCGVSMVQELNDTRMRWFHTLDEHVGTGASHETVACECIPPFSGNATGCTTIDCSGFTRNAEVIPSTNESTGECECPTQGYVFGVPWYDTSLRDSLSACHRPCNVFGTIGVQSTFNQCVCREGYLGVLCDVLAPADPELRYDNSSGVLTPDVLRGNANNNNTPASVWGPLLGVVSVIGIAGLWVVSWQYVSVRSVSSPVRYTRYQPAQNSRASANTDISDTDAFLRR